MIAMTVSQIVEAMRAECASGLQNNKVSRVMIDSRIVKPGDLFFAIRGERFDGHDFVDQAITLSATACVVDQLWYESKKQEDSECCVPFLVVHDTVAALGKLAAYYRRSMM